MFSKRFSEWAKVDFECESGGIDLVMQKENPEMREPGIWVRTAMVIGIVDH